MKLEAIEEQSRESQASEASAEGLHLLDLLIILSRRRKFIALFTLGVAILTAIVVLIIPSEYTAGTVVMPPSQNTSLSSTLLGQLGGASALASAAGAGLGIRSPGDMYVSLFRSRTVEDSMIERFGLMARYKGKKMSDARTAFEDRSTVVLGNKDGLIRITVTDRDPKFAADMANGYVEQFRKLSANLAITEASQRRVFFQQQLLEANENLTTAEEAMKRTQQSTGVLQVDSQARSLIESGAVLRGQIVAKEVEVQAMRS
jgi:tyrosine-protein kinase Etk/Wzc